MRVCESVSERGGGVGGVGESERKHERGGEEMEKKSMQRCV